MAAHAVLINADDLGLWPSVTDGILDAWRGRAISDSTVFANTPDLPDVLAAARDAGLPVGIHLNLTWGTPLSDPADIPALTTRDGHFMKRQQWALPLPRVQVQRELRRQVERVLAAGWQPSHLDSHHHIHTYPEVFDAVVELALDYHLPVRAVQPEMRDALRAEGIPTPDHFSMAFYGERATVDTLIELVEACEGGTLEIMTHPGQVMPDLPSSYRDERATELAVLTSPRWQNYVLEHGIHLLGFGALQ